MNPVIELERMGYRFKLEGDHVVVRRYSAAEPPERAKKLLEELNKEQVKQVLIDRQNGFSEAPAGILMVQGQMILPVAKKIKAALDSGELWDVRVRYNKTADSATFQWWPAEWGPEP